MKSPAAITANLIPGRKPNLLPSIRAMKAAVSVPANTVNTGLSILAPIKPRLIPIKSVLKLPATDNSHIVRELSIRIIRSSGLNLRVSKSIFSPIMNIRA